MNKLPITKPKQSTIMKRLGINGVMTADMMWIYVNTKHPYLTELPKDGRSRIMELTRRVDVLPAWSSQTLLNMFPESIDDYQLHCYPITMDGKKMWYIAYSKDGMTLRVAYGIDLLDAAIKMVQWLVKNNHIEQKYLSNDKDKEQTEKVRNL